MSKHDAIFNFIKCLNSLTIRNMDVKQNTIDDLNATLTIKITNKDYNDNYEKSLKTYKKQIQMPGFRSGQIPTSIVKKKYGPSILAEEIDKLLNEALSKHITENKLNVLGNPLPVADDQMEIDWNNPGDFEFTYELGLAPEFSIELPGKDKHTYHKVKIDDSLVDKQVEDFARRYGKLSSTDKSEAKDMIMASFTELDENDKPVEGGFVHSSTVSIEFTEDKKAQKKLIGLKAGDTLIIDPKTISKGESDMAAMLGISNEVASTFNNNVELKVTDVKRLEPAAVNEELFDKIYGPGEVKTEKEFREKIANELSGMFEKDSDRVFKRDFAENTIKKLKLSLPDEFLKKWILSSNKNEISADQIDAEFDQYSESLKWQLIENKIIKENDIKVENDEVVSHTKELLGSQYAQYGMPVPGDDEMTKYAHNVLSNQEEARKIYDSLYDQKVLNFLKETVKIAEKEVSYDDFVKVASKA